MRKTSRCFPIQASAQAERAVQHEVDESIPILAKDSGLRVTCAVQLRRDAAERALQERLRTAQHETQAAMPEHHLELLRLENELARQKYQQQVIAEKIDFYQAQLARGGVQALALHLAEHPDDTRLVVDNLRADDSALVDRQSQLIGRMLQDDAFEEYQLDETRQLMLQRIKEFMVERPTTASGPLPPPADPPPHPELSSHPTQQDPDQP